MNPSEANRPLRVLERALNGGLGAGNLGVVMARPGTGKVAVLTSISVDHAMDGKNVLHVAIGKSVSTVRAYDDEVLEQISDRYDLQDRSSLHTAVERHKQIYTFKDSASFTREKLRHALDILAEHAEFHPALIEIQGWPDWRDLTEDEVEALKGIAKDYNTEIWLTAQTHRNEEETDERGVPAFLSRFDQHFSVIMALEPEGDHIPIRFIKVHDSKEAPAVNLELDPKTLLIRWR